MLKTGEFELAFEVLSLGCMSKSLMPLDEAALKPHLWPTINQVSVVNESGNVRKKVAAGKICISCIGKTYQRPLSEMNIRERVDDRQYHSR